MLRPMSEAPKDRTPVLALTRADLAAVRADLDRWSSKWVVVHHPGTASDGWDKGWIVNAPVGTGGLPDDWFIGWQSLPETSTVQEKAEIMRDMIVLMLIRLARRFTDAGYVRAHLAEAEKMQREFIKFGL